MEKLLHERLSNYAENFSSLNKIQEHEDVIHTIDLLKKWSNEIKRFYIPRPRFEDGEPLQFGDKTEYHKNVESILLKADGSFETHQKMSNSNGTCVGIYNRDELVYRPKPKDTIKRIKDDATMNPREYYQKHIGKDVYCKDDEQVITAFVNDLLRRQREVFEGNK